MLSSIAATVRVSAFDSASRPAVIKRAIVLAEGVRRNPASSIFSARRLRHAYSETTRNDP
jgi:hypothetical protein